MDSEEARLSLVSGVWLCDACLDGIGGECHTPGCVLFLNKAPDIPIRQHILDARGQISASDTTVHNERRQSHRE